MWFTDIRTFGTLYLVTDNDTYIEGYETLGPEPLSEGFTAGYLLPLAQKARRLSKALFWINRLLPALAIFMPMNVWLCPAFCLCAKPAA